MVLDEQDIPSFTLRQLKRLFWNSMFIYLTLLFHTGSEFTYGDSPFPFILGQYQTTLNICEYKYVTTDKALNFG